MACNPAGLHFVIAVLLTSLLTGTALSRHVGADKASGGAVDVHNFLGSKLDETVEILRSRYSGARGLFFSASKIGGLSQASPENYVLIIPAPGPEAILAVTFRVREANKDEWLTANMVTLSLSGGGGFQTRKRREECRPIGNCKRWPMIC
ncbi:MAG: hypothetical protein N3C12_10855 [Candidatus Binatia bacterium]|nr:hypothetical protein [Candidatus Binatia bacterium]